MSRIQMLGMQSAVVIPHPRDQTAAALHCLPVVVHMSAKH